MKRIAILTDSTAPVSEAVQEQMNAGNRYRVGKVPAELSTGDIDALADALRGEGIDLLIVENYSGQLPVDFPFAVLKVAPGEDATTLTERIRRECPDYSAEQRWADALGESFDHNSVTPPPAPGMQTPPPSPVSVQPQAPVYPQNPTMTEAPAFNSAFAGNRHEEQYPNQRPAMPDNYMLWSILAVVFCCFIPAIVALVFSMRVSSRYYAGDYAGAEKASRMAQIWIIVSIVAGIITNALYLPLMLMTGA